jgi:hypothetical protein
MNICFLEFDNILIQAQLGWIPHRESFKYTFYLSNETLLVIKTIEMKSMGKQSEFYYL